MRSGILAKRALWLAASRSGFSTIRTAQQDSGPLATAHVNKVWKCMRKLHCTTSEFHIHTFNRFMTSVKQFFSKQIETRAVCTELLTGKPRSTDVNRLSSRFESWTRSYGSRFLVLTIENKSYPAREHVPGMIGKSQLGSRGWWELSNVQTLSR